MSAFTADGGPIGPRRAAAVAAGLSALLPGLGQLYNRERAKGVALLLTAAGVLGGLLWSTLGPRASRSAVTVALLLPVYLLLWLPAVHDAYKRARGAGQTFLTSTGPWYVIVMLVTLGPFALPLLWQSPAFSRAAKIWLTVVVVAIALFAVLLIVLMGAFLEDRLPAAAAERGQLGNWIQSSPSGAVS